MRPVTTRTAGCDALLGQMASSRQPSSGALTGFDCFELALWLETLKFPPHFAPKRVFDSYSRICNATSRVSAGQA